MHARSDLYATLGELLLRVEQVPARAPRVLSRTATKSRPPASPACWLGPGQGDAAARATSAAPETRAQEGDRPSTPTAGEN